MNVDDDSANAQRELVERHPPDRKGVDRKGVEEHSPKARRAPKAAKTILPSDFVVSERVKTWAAAKGYRDLDQHLEAFKSKAVAKGYTYVDWDEALMGAIRDDWAKLRVPGVGAGTAANTPWAGAR